MWVGSSSCVARSLDPSHSSECQRLRRTCQVLPARLYHRFMNRITLSWEAWRAVIAVLREKQLPYMREHADHIERLLELGIPLPPMER